MTNTGAIAAINFSHMHNWGICSRNVFRSPPRAGDCAACCDERPNQCDANRREGASGFLTSEVFSDYDGHGIDATELDDPGPPTGSMRVGRTDCPFRKVIVMSSKSPCAISIEDADSHDRVLPKSPTNDSIINWPDARGS